MISERRPRGSELALIALFLALIFTVPLAELALELKRGESPRVLQVFHTKPKASNLRAYERDLEEHSRVAGALRPWVQQAEFRWFRNGGEKAVVGQDGWLFYRPGLLYLTERAVWEKSQTTVPQVASAIIGLRDKLAARGIHLLVMPAPNKESIYPEKLVSGQKTIPGPLSEETLELLAKLRDAHIPCIDLFTLFTSLKGNPQSKDLYLAQDSHWSPAGVAAAAQAVANAVLERGWLTAAPVSCCYTARTVSVTRYGDVLRMLQLPKLEGEAVACSQVLACADGRVYSDDPRAEVLVLGDSFLRIFEQDEPGGAGFIAHLAKELGRPVTSIVNDGGASTLVRQELFRRPALLLNKKVVIWEFVERDIRFGTEGWQDIPLPAPQS